MAIFYRERGRVIPTESGMQALRAWVESAPNAGEKGARALHIKSLHTRRGAVAKTLGFFWLDVPFRAAGAAVRAGYQPSHTCPLCGDLATRGLTPRGATPKIQAVQGLVAKMAVAGGAETRPPAPPAPPTGIDAVRRWRTLVYGVIGDIGAHLGRIHEAADGATKGRVASEARAQMPEWRAALHGSPSQAANDAGDTLCDVALRFFNAIWGGGEISEAMEQDFYAALSDHLDAVNRVFADAGLDPID